MRVILGLLMVSLSVGCAHMASVTPAAVGNSALLTLSLEQAWERTSRVLAAQKPVVRTANFAQFFITTNKATVKLTETQADCGTAAGTPYVTDARTVTEVAYSVYLQRDGDRTKIIVNTTIDGRFKATAAQERATELSCVSLGSLERDLITKIQRE